MIAEVIPLRRRAHDGTSTPPEAEHCSVFDAPPDPQPPQEYSVWERPTAQLIRRQAPEELASVKRRRLGLPVQAIARSWAGGGAAALLLALAATALITTGAQRSPQRSHTASVARAALGLGAALTGAPAPGYRPSAGIAVRSAARRLSHRAAARKLVLVRPSAPPSQIEGSPAPSASSTGETTYAREQADVSQAPPQPQSETAGATAAEREFGFER